MAMVVSSSIPPAFSILSATQMPKCIRRKSLSLAKFSFCAVNPVDFHSKRRVLSIQAAAAAAAAEGASQVAASLEKEEVFFDGGPHYGDLVTNLVFGFSLLWLPLTMAAVFRALFLRYRFTNLRVTILSGLRGGDRKDFKYDVIKDVKYVPRFIGEWGDLVITLRDETKVELKCVPSFKEIAKYCLQKAGKAEEEAAALLESSKKKKGFLP